MAVQGLEETVALGLTFVVHVVGAALLVWAMLDRDDVKGGRSGWWPRDDGPGDPPPPEPRPGPSGDRMPLPGAAPSPVRLREDGGRIAEGYPRRPRRPDHAPQRTPDRVP